MNTIERILQSGGWVTIIVLLPNLFALIYPPLDSDNKKDIHKEHTKYRIMEILERVGQISSFVLPFLYTIDGSMLLNRKFIVIGMMICILVYYFCWIRFLVERKREYFYKKILIIPLPMALTPILYFVMSALLFESKYLLVGSILLAVGHIYISNYDYQEIRRQMLKSAESRMPNTAL